MGYSLDLYTYRVSYMVSGAGGMDTSNWLDSPVNCSLDLTGPVFTGDTQASEQERVSGRAEGASESERRREKKERDTEKTERESKNQEEEERERCECVCVFCVWVEFEWLRQYWFQGRRYARFCSWWSKPMERLESDWKEMERMVFARDARARAPQQFTSRVPVLEGVEGAGVITWSMVWKNARLSSTPDVVFGEEGPGGERGEQRRDYHFADEIVALLWSSAVELCCGALLWSSAVELCCGALLWSSAVEFCCGALLWSPAEELC
ncbi:hypothetical protein NFI96_008130 [Prochilodus magdalenae]|nr:hypothetical protein NFI96_008130 [Prochilodus magdalenae]